MKDGVHVELSLTIVVLVVLVGAVLGIGVGYLFSGFVLSLLLALFVIFFFRLVFGGIDIGEGAGMFLLFIVVPFCAGFFLAAGITWAYFTWVGAIAHGSTIWESIRSYIFR